MYRPHEQYRRMQTETSNSVELVVLLYQGAIRFLNRAAMAVDRRDYPAAHTDLIRAQEIISELKNCLNPEAGEITVRLNKVYSFMLERLVAANVSKQRKPIDEVLRLLQPLLTSWQEIARRSQPREVVTAGPAA